MEKKLPKGWLETNISNLLVDDKLFTDGDWIESKDQDEDGDVRLIQLADIGLNEFKNKSNRKLYYNKAIELRCFFLEKNDVLIARLPDPLGRSCLFPLEGNYVTVVDVAVIRLNDSYYKPKLLSYFINSPEIQKRIMELSSGSTRLRISRKNLNTISIPFPPLAEQERIASKLDELFGRIEVIKASMEKIPQLLKDFRQQVLTSAVTGKLTEEWREGKELESNSINFNNDVEKEFSMVLPVNWKETAVGNIFKFQQGMQIAKSTRLLAFEENTLPILRIKNYHDGFLTDVEYVKLNEKSLIAEKDDIIMTRTGESRGWVLTGFRGVFHNNTFRINYDDSFFNNRFVYYQLSSSRIQEFIRIKSGRTGQPDLSHKMFAPCPFAIPPLAEQEEIVSRVESLFAKADKIEERYISLKKKIDVLPQLLLHKAFKGELVEQLLTDGDAADLLKEIMALKKDVKKKK